MLKTLKALLTPTYNVIYAPARSECNAPIQKYKVLGNPVNAGWVSGAGNKLFTLPVINKGPRAFRCDRVLGVSFAIV